MPLRRILLASLVFAAGGWSQPCTVSTLAGRPIAFSGDGGPALEARFFGANGVAVAPDGHVFVLDRLNRRIRAFTPGGTISTVAGTGAYGDTGDGGPATAATFRSLSAVAIDGLGNVFVADTEARRIRKIDTNGVISHFAGTGIWRYSGDGGPAALAGLGWITSLAAGPDGTVYVLDEVYRCVRKIGPDGKIDRFAGKRNRAAFLESSDPLDFTGPALDATLRGPRSITVDGQGNLYIADSFDNLIRKVTHQGIISRFAGGGFPLPGDGGPALNAHLQPGHISADSAGNVYIQDTRGTFRIRRVLPGGEIQAFAQTPVPFAAGAGGAVYGMQADTILRITAGADPERIAGMPTTGFNGDNRPALGATLGLQSSSGVIARSDGSVLFADTQNARIRSISPSGVISTIAGGGATAPGSAAIPATAAKLIAPSGLRIDAAENIYFADTSLHAIFKIDRTGMLIRIGGNGDVSRPGRFDEDRPATEAPLYFPSRIAVTPSGDVYVVQPQFGPVIWKIQSNGRLRSATLHSFGGSRPPDGPIVADTHGNVFFVSMEKPSVLARIGTDGAVSETPIAPLFLHPFLSSTSLTVSPHGLLAGAAGVIRISDNPESVMTLGKPPAFSDGSPDDGPVTEAHLGTPGQISFDKNGNLLFVDTLGQRIRRISAGCAVTAQPTLTKWVNGATFDAAGASPGELMTLFGVNLGPREGQGAKLDDQGKVSTELGGTRVLVDGVPAPILFSRADQVNFVLPFAMEGRSAFYLQLEHNGVHSELLSMGGADANPALFVLGATSTLNPFKLAFLNSDGSVNSPSNPARKGSVVVAYGTGFGQTSPSGIDGLPNQSPFPRPVLPVQLKIGETTVPVQFLGGAPGLVAGVMQLNVQIPESLEVSGCQTVDLKMENIHTFARTVVCIQ